MLAPAVVHVFITFVAQQGVKADLQCLGFVSQGVGAVVAVVNRHAGCALVEQLLHTLGITQLQRDLTLSPGRWGCPRVRFAGLGEPHPLPGIEKLAARNRPAQHQLLTLVRTL